MAPGNAQRTLAFSAVALALVGIAMIAMGALPAAPSVDLVAVWRHWVNIARRRARMWKRKNKIENTRRRNQIWTTLPSVATCLSLSFLLSLSLSTPWFQAILIIFWGIFKFTKKQGGIFLIREIWNEPYELIVWFSVTKFVFCSMTRYRDTVRVFCPEGFFFGKSPFKI